MKTILTPQEVYEKLLNEDKILTLQGRIQFTLGDVNIIVKQKDVVGNIIQEWLEGWLNKRNIAFTPNENPQMPPDLFLNEDKTKDLLEVKAFNRSASPGFDIADFKAYQREIIARPYMLHAKYIIFGYDMTDEGVVTIKDLWLKNVWEICRTSEKWPINVQFKNNMVHKIRPAQWFSDGQRIKYPTFKTLEHYLAAIEETVYKNPDTRDVSSLWRDEMEKNYNKFYNSHIQIPRWNDIKDQYTKIKNE